MAKSPTTHVAGVRMPNTLYAKISKMAASEHRTVSNFIVKALLEKYGEERPHANGATHKAAKQQVAA